MRSQYIISRLGICLIVFMISIPMYSQMFRKESFLELEFGLGPNFMTADIGDLGKGGNLGVALRYRVQDHLALRAVLNGGLILGNDAGTDNDSRGYKYYTYFGELTGQLEFWFLKEGRGFSSQGMRAYKPLVQPYVYAGGGPVYFIPNHYHEDAAELDSFDPFTIMLAGGVGFLFKVNHDFLWGFQAGARITPTDYLDGYSPSTSESNDMYFSSQFNLVYRF
jgi:hypothetical protein